MNLSEIISLAAGRSVVVASETLHDGPYIVATTTEGDEWMISPGPGHVIHVTSKNGDINSALECPHKNMR